jgi:hypothetical protein
MPLSHVLPSGGMIASDGGFLASKKIFPKMAPGCQKTSWDTLPTAFSRGLRFQTP